MYLDTPSDLVSHKKISTLVTKNASHFNRTRMLLKKSKYRPRLIFSVISFVSDTNHIFIRSIYNFLDHPFRLGYRKLHTSYCLTEDVLSKAVLKQAICISLGLLLSCQKRIVRPSIVKQLSSPDLKSNVLRV